VRDMEWRLRAACRGMDPELFFPSAETGRLNTVRINRAKAVCAGCPVVLECRVQYMDQEWGVFGGLSADDRRLVRRRARGRTLSR
jgi:WhiB family redox-sensing transcriptional regulator